MENQKAILFAVAVEVGVARGIFSTQNLKLYMKVVQNRDRPDEEPQLEGFSA